MFIFSVIYEFILYHFLNIYIYIYIYIYNANQIILDEFALLKKSLLKGKYYIK